VLEKRKEAKKKKKKKKKERKEKKVEHKPSDNSPRRQHIKEGTLI
jgi:hypothetical protein